MGKRKRISESDEKAAELSRHMDDAEDRIREHLDALSVYRTQTDCFFHTDENQGVPVYDEKVDYYSEFWKMFVLNEIMVPQLKKLVAEVNALEEGLESADKMFDEHEFLQRERMKKKHRRLAAQIAKEYPCPYDNCQKMYGTDVSLNLHMKIKHNGGNKTEREILAKQCLKVLAKGLPMPKINIVFPPGYLENLKQSLADKKRD